MEIDKVKENPILQYAPSEFFSEEALKAAEAIRSRDYPTLAAIFKRTPEIAANRGTKEMPLVAWAMSHDDPKSVKLLLDAGAPVDDYILDKDDKVSLLSLAIGSQIPEFFDLLLSHGANPNGVSEEQPPLFVTVILSGYVYSDRFERLLEAGADPNQRNKAGVPIIHACVDSNDYEKVLELVKRGADPKAKDNGLGIRWDIDRNPPAPGTSQAHAKEELARILRALSGSNLYS